MINNTGLEDVIGEIIDRKIKAAFKEKNYEASYDGIVDSVDEAENNNDPYSQRAEIIIPGYNAGVYLRNLSGELLSVGDHVKIYARENNLSNGYIGIKCN